eukprot:gene15476-21562_t
MDGLRLGVSQRAVGLVPCKPRSLVARPSLGPGLRLSSKPTKVTRVASVWPVSATFRPGLCRAVSGGERGVQSEAERFIESVQEAAAQEFADEEAEESQLLATIPQLRGKMTELKAQVAELSSKINASFKACFSQMTVELAGEEDEEGTPGEPVSYSFLDIDEVKFAELGRAKPEVINALLELKETTDSAGWQAFQMEVRTCRCRGPRSRVFSDRDVLSRRDKVFSDRDVLSQRDKVFSDRDVLSQRDKVFSDRDVLSQRDKVEAALKGADVFFGSLIFDFDQIPICLVFESALELMSTTELQSDARVCAHSMIIRYLYRANSGDAVWASGKY